MVRVARQLQSIAEARAYETLWKWILNWEGLMSGVKRRRISKRASWMTKLCVFSPERTYVSTTQRSALRGGFTIQASVSEDTSLTVCYMWFQVWFSKAAAPLNCCKGSLHMKYANNIGFTLLHLPTRVHRNTCVSHRAALFVWPAAWRAVLWVPAAFLWLRFKHARKHWTQSSL